MSRLAVVTCGLVAALLLVTWRARGSDNDLWVLTPDVETSLQGLIQDVNTAHALGETISIAGIWVERNHVRIGLAEASNAGTVEIVLVRASGENGAGKHPWARWFEYRSAKADVTGPMANALARLGPLLDTRFRSDPWVLARVLANPAVGAVDESATVRSRRRVLGGVAIIGALSIFSLVVLAIAVPDE